jgi:CNT family concentrative nucleoside transporter
MMERVVSFAGIFVFMLLAWLCSNKRCRVNRRVIIWGLVLQFCFAGFIFAVPLGSRFFLAVNTLVVKVLDCAAQGTDFVFGVLSLPPGQKGSLGFILAFQAFPTIIFFSSLVSVLYYLRIMPLVIRGFARLFTRLMRISGAESLAAASNIFVGVEAAFTVRPHLATMTRSEICTLLTAGMATVASNVLALYVYTLRDVFPAIAGHLVSASILSAPAAIIMSKLIWPESEQPETLGCDVEPRYERPENIFLAVINGAREGVEVVLSISALLIAVLGLTALLDQGLGLVWPGLSLKMLLTWLAWPLTWLLGIPLADVGKIAPLIGEKLVLTEVVAYRDLAELLADQALSCPRSAVIAAYALCGFTHIASVAIFVGALIGIAPERSRDITRVAFRALIAATLACLMTGAIAGVFQGCDPRSGLDLIRP